MLDLPMETPNAMHLSDFAERFRHECADIVVLREEFARLGAYADFFHAFCILEGDLYSINVAYSMMPYYAMNTRAFHRDELFLTRYARGECGFTPVERIAIGPGEDPRIVSDGRRAYAIIIANKFSGERVLLFDLCSRKLISLRVSAPQFDYGKNWQPYLLNGELFIVHELTPFRILKVDTETGETRIVKEFDISFKLPCFHSTYPMFRGGSNAISHNGLLLGLGRATSQRYRHHPFFWSFDGKGKLAIQFTEFFYAFHRCGYSILDPTSLFFDGDDLYVGLCCTERDWAHDQIVTNFLLRFSGPRSNRTAEPLENFLTHRGPTETNGVPNLGRHMFFCAEMPCAIASKHEYGGRVSTGSPGHLVYGPYIPVLEKGRFCAQLNYLSKEGGSERAGSFDVIVSRGAEFRTLGHLDLKKTNGDMMTATIEFDTTDLVGTVLEFRVHVDEGVELNAFHVRTWREPPDGHEARNAAPYNFNSRGG